MRRSTQPPLTGPRSGPPCSSAKTLFASARAGARSHRAAAAIVARPRLSCSFRPPPARAHSFHPDTTFPGPDLSPLPPHRRCHRLARPRVTLILSPERYPAPTPSPRAPPEGPSPGLLSESFAAPPCRRPAAPLPNAARPAAGGPAPDGRCRRARYWTAAAAGCSVAGDRPSIPHRVSPPPQRPTVRGWASLQVCSTSGGPSQHWTVNMAMNNSRPGPARFPVLAGLTAGPTRPGPVSCADRTREATTGNVGGSTRRTVPQT